VTPSSTANALSRLPDPLEVGFLLLPQFSMIAFSSAVEPLRMANMLAGRTLFRWSVLSGSGPVVAASNGLRLGADHELDAVPPLHAVFVCGGIEIHRATARPVLAFLQRQAQRGTVLGALCTGSYVLAKAGLLDGYRSTIHWEQMAGLREEHPNLLLSPELFEIDRDRFTCSGGTAPLDMMLHLIGARHGAPLAAAISEEFVCERIRGPREAQRMPLRLRLGTSHPRLVDAVMLMEANLEEPMSPDEIARHVELSRRQLERLFRKYLDCVPTRYYLELRLARARQLLLQTNRAVADVAVACGFASAPHFSKCYREHYGIAPRMERKHSEPHVLGRLHAGEGRQPARRAAGG
jgi:transcriptional regulator GlxA family with amidase domain